MIIQWRVKGLDMVDIMPEELWKEIHNIVQEGVTKTIPSKNKCKKTKWLSKEGLQTAKERRELKSKGKEEKYFLLKVEFQKIRRKDKRAFLNEHCKVREEDNRIGKTGDLFKKIGEIKGTFHLRMSMIMDRNGKELTEAEEIKNIQKTLLERSY